MNELFDLAKSITRVSQNAMQTGFDLGVIEGLSRAAKYCEEKAAMHATYLPTPLFQYNEFHPTTRKVMPELSATCGRRDECTNLAYELRQKITKRTQAWTEPKDAQP